MAISTFLHIIQAIQEEEKLIPGQYRARRRIVVDSIVKMVKSYSDKNFKSENPITVDYNLPQFRCAYSYKYLTSHVRFIREYLWWAACQLQDQMQNKMEMQICSIGGGPGSDLFGVLQFLRETAWWGTRTITADIFDLHAKGWKKTNIELKKRLEYNHNSIKAVSYHQYNFFNSSHLMFSKIANADLVTMIKFLSAVLNEQNRVICKEILKEMIENLKENALLYFIDNTGGGSLKLMCDIAKECRLVPIVTTGLTNFEWALPETMELYKTEFGNIFPQLQTQLAVGLWQKKSINSRFNSFMLTVNNTEKFYISSLTINNYLDKLKIGIYNFQNNGNLLTYYAENLLQIDWEKWRENGEMKKLSSGNSNANLNQSNIASFRGLNIYQPIVNNGNSSRTQIVTSPSLSGQSSLKIQNNPSKAKTYEGLYQEEILNVISFGSTSARRNIDTFRNSPSGQSSNSVPVWSVTAPHINQSVSATQNSPSKATRKLNAEPPQKQKRVANQPTKQSQNSSNYERFSSLTLQPGTNQSGFENYHSDFLSDGHVRHTTYEDQEVIPNVKSYGSISARRNVYTFRNSPSGQSSNSVPVWSVTETHINRSVSATQNYSRQSHDHIEYLNENSECKCCCTIL